MSQFKYFSPWEIKGLKIDLVYKLDRARMLYGHPIMITSGFRTPEQNKSIGGVKDSAHVKGMAVDIRCPDQIFLKEKLLWALGAAGFFRVGSYNEHIHADIDTLEKPAPAFWTGESK